MFCHYFVKEMKIFECGIYLKCSSAYHTVYNFLFSLLMNEKKSCYIHNYLDPPCVSPVEGVLTSKDANPITLTTIYELKFQLNFA